MSAFEKTDTKDPSLFGILFFAIIVALIGSLSGFAVLAATVPKPFGSIAEYESSLEDDCEPRLLNPHYFKGPVSSLDNWALKREILLNKNDTTLELTDLEINNWITNKFGFIRTPFPDKEESKVVIVPGLPNVFISVDKGVHFNITLELIGMDRRIDFLVIGEGYFSDEKPARFYLSKLRVNEAPIPLSAKLNSLNSNTLEPLLELLRANDEFVALEKAWEKVDSVELIENGVRLKLN